HNGKKMTADDVVFSIMAIHGKKVSAGHAQIPLDVFGGARKLGPLEVEITTKSPYRTLERMRWWWIRPADPSIKPTHPIGTGPFSFVELTRGQQIVTAKHDAYWNSGRPHLGGITFRFVPDIAVALTNVRSGTLDYIHDVPAAQLKQVNLPNTKLID